MLAPIALAGALVLGLTGFGSALVTVPLASHFLPLPFVLAVFAVADLTSVVRLGLQRPQEVVWPEWLRMAPMIVLGIALGSTLLLNLPRTAGTLALGGFVVLYSVYSLMRRGPPGRVARGWSYAAGLAGGLSGSLFGAGGPPYAIYLASRGLDHTAFRATLAAVSIVSIGTRLLAYLVAGLLAQDGLWYAIAAAVPGALLGLTLASRVSPRISRTALARAVALTLLASGLSLLVRALR
ncbi:MAG: sulfite exporter TauE/SafE family protein [Burkholderiales bacterium]|nr:sulfite exporter TauE/SafE family protein [Burkholderiales bacterium]